MAPNLGLEGQGLVTLALSTLILAYLLKKLYASWQIHSRLPPGPYGLPLIGYLPFLGKNIHLTFSRLGKKFGGVYSLNFAGTPVVILNDWESIKEALSKDEFLGRPSPSPFSVISKEKSIVDINGKEWREQRRFALHVLRDLGFGKSSMEVRITEEIAHLIKEIDGRDNPVNIHDLMTPSVSNNICALVFGHRFDYLDPDRIKMDTALSVVPKFIKFAGAMTIFPGLFRFCMNHNIFGLGQLRTSIDEIIEFAGAQIEDHKKSLEKSNVRDYIDAFLLEMEERKEKGDMGTFSLSMLKQNVRGFFGAGSETVRTTMDWVIIAIANNPQIQDKVQTEIDTVIGKDRLPSWSDRPLLPYCQAVIMEIQRWASVVPLNLPRCAMADTTVGGHFIPKGTFITANFWAVNRDPNLWENPEEINPNRFLSKDGQQVIKNEALIPFSYGKRNCVGEGLAQVELFLYFTSIFQKYRVSVPQGKSLSIERVLGITLSPKEVPIVYFDKRA